MASFLVKALYATLGTGLACAVPVSLFYGLKGGFGTSSLNPSVNSAHTTTPADTSESQETYSASRPKITCQRNGEEERMQYLEGTEVSPELQKQIEQEMRSADGQCVDYQGQAD